MNVLFVCTANISRSFLADKLMKHAVKERDLNHVFSRSAGVYAEPGRSPDPKMVNYLAEKHIPAGDHEARLIQEDDVAWADYILVMEKAHAVEIVKLWPQAKRKIELLGRYVTADPSADDVVDPFGRTPFHYRLAQLQIALGVNNFIEMTV